MLITNQPFQIQRSRNTMCSELPVWKRERERDLQGFLKNTLVDIG